MQPSQAQQCGKRRAGWNARILDSSSPAATDDGAAQLWTLGYGLVPLGRPPVRGVGSVDTGDGMGKEWRIRSLVDVRVACGGGIWVHGAEAVRVHANNLPTYLSVSLSTCILVHPTR